MINFSIKNLFLQLGLSLLLALAVLLVLGQANPLTTKLGRDSGIYAYVGRQVLHGIPPYVTAWESKPPGIFFINALALLLGRGTRWGIWAVEFVFLLASAWLGFFTLSKKFGQGPALLASLIWLAGLNIILDGGNLTEEYSLIFGMLAVFLLSRMFEAQKHQFWLDILLGLFSGLNFLLRPNNIGAQFSLVLTLIIIQILQSRTLTLVKRLLIIFCAGALPVLATGLYFWGHGALQPFLDASFLYNFSYTGSHFNPISSLFAGVESLGFSIGIAGIGYFLALGELGSQVKNRSLDPFVLWIVLDGVVEVFFSGLSGRNYEHYFINWLPLVAVSSAYLLFTIMPGFMRWSEKRFGLIVSLLLVIVLDLYFDGFRTYWLTFEQLASGTPQVEQPDRVARYINENTQPGETVLVWGGQAGVNFLAERDAPTPYTFYPLYVPSKVTDRISLEFYQAMLVHPPELIVDGSYYSSGTIIPLSAINPSNWMFSRNGYSLPYLEEFYAFFRSNYSYKTSITGIPIYRLNGK